MNRWLAGLCVVALVSFAVGCGGGAKKDKLYTVKGTLTVGGKVVGNVRVTFYPTGEGAPSSGLTNDKGEFALASQKGPKGAVAGKHKVVLTVDGAGEAMYMKSGPSRDPMMQKKPFPKQFGSLQTTTKEVEVDANDDNNIKIEL